MSETAALDCCVGSWQAGSGDNWSACYKTPSRIFFACQLSRGITQTALQQQTHNARYLLVVLRIGRVVDRRPYNGAEIARFEPFYAENDHVTKTGSGQTW
jgi:hypothetical protein